MVASGTAGILPEIVVLILDDRHLRLESRAEQREADASILSGGREGGYGNGGAFRATGACVVANLLFLGWGGVLVGR